MSEPIVRRPVMRSGKLFEVVENAEQTSRRKQQEARASVISLIFCQGRTIREAARINQISERRALDFLIDYHEEQKSHWQVSGWRRGSLHPPSGGAALPIRREA